MKAGYYWCMGKGDKTPIIMELSEWGQWWRCGIDAAEWNEPRVIEGPIALPIEFINGDDVDTSEKT